MDSSQFSEKEDAITEKVMELVKQASLDQKKDLLATLTEWIKGNQRNDTRLSCMLSVDYSTKDRAYKDFIQNLSNGGVFIETREPFAVGKDISLTFSVPNSENHFKISGEIIRNQKDGIAVQFYKKLSGYQKQMIQSAIT